MIKREELIQLGAKPQDVDKHLQSIIEACTKYEINTPARKSQFFAQLYVESVNLSKTAENLNYSAEALLQYFPSKIKTMAEAKAIERNQKAIALKVYNNRQGRGLIQLTGEANQDAFGKAYNLDIKNHPELLEQPPYAALSAGWFWNARRLNSIADIDTETTVRTITKMVNGPAMLGLEERTRLWKKAKEIFK